MSEVSWQLLSPYPLNTKEEARRLFDMWATLAPEALPQRYGIVEPLRGKFSIDSLEEVISVWELSIHLKRQDSTKLESSVIMQYGPHRKHSSWSISLRERHNEVLSEMLARAAVRFSADFAYFHLPLKSDAERGSLTNTLYYSDDRMRKTHMFVSTFTLRKSIPDIYWTTIFGRPYVGLFGRERLLSSPAFRVKELENGSILIQATQCLHDLKTEPTKFSEVQALIKRHLGGATIFDLADGFDHKYKVPEFIWK